MEKLLQPFETKGLRFRNRIVHVATTMNMSDPQGYATRRLAAVYGTLARGGYGATMVGATCVRRDGLINERMLGLYDEDYVIEFRDVVAEIRNNESLAGIQLFYGGLIPGLGTTVPLQPGKGWIPGTVAWGPGNKYVIGNPQSEVIPTAVYEDIVESYGQAARRAREAGFDFVSFHFCHGSLPHTNLSLLANQGRTDKYADHFLFCEEIIQRTQQLCGKDFPIIPRVCCDENLQGGFDIDYFVEHYAPRLHALGIAALDATFGSMLGAPSRRPDIHSTEFIGPSFYSPKVVNRENIQRLRAGLVARGIDMPLIGSANLITPDHLRDMVEVAGADFAGVCRLSLDDPDFPNKIIEGREHEIRKSTHTGASLLQGNIFGKGWAGSAQNPTFGRDDEYRIRPTARPRRILVVGGGSGGMEYAITAREIGHDVTLMEASATLGGAMDWAGNYPNLPNMEMLRYQPEYHRAMMDKHAVPRELGVDVTPDVVRAFAPDLVVVATGAEAVVPDVPGMAAARASGFALTLDDVLARSGAPTLGGTVLVWGASEGAELAVDLKRGGRTVRLLDRLPTYVPANYIGSRVYSIMGLLAVSGIAVEGGLDLHRVGDGVVEFRNDAGEVSTVAADALVVCAGRRPRNGLVDVLRAERRVVQVIGDAREVRSYGNAIHEAAYLVRQVYSDSRSGRPIRAGTLGQPSNPDLKRSTAMRLQGKTALITGAARGLGAQIARRFHEAGANVIINDLSLAAAQVTARALGGEALACDVSQPDSVRAMFADAAKLTDRIDILVNNAGISGMEGDNSTRERIARMVEAIEAGTEPEEGLTGNFTDYTDDAWRRMIGVHLDGTFYCSREAVKVMMPAGGGNIINMSSIMGTFGRPGGAAYCAAKAGILGLTRALAHELARHSIRVNAIAPGWIRTDMTDPLAPMHPMLEAQTPLGRLGEPDDIAWAAVYLASDESKFVTGQCLSPNGGWYMSQ